MSDAEGGPSSCSSSCSRTRTPSRSSSCVNARATNPESPREPTRLRTAAASSLGRLMESLEAGCLIRSFLPWLECPDKALPRVVSRPHRRFGTRIALVLARPSGARYVCRLEQGARMHVSTLLSITIAIGATTGLTAARGSDATSRDGSGGAAGASGNGAAPGNAGAPGNGASGNGASGNGASGNGASGNGASGNGASGNGASGGSAGGATGSAGASSGGRSGSAGNASGASPGSGARPTGSGGALPGGGGAGSSCPPECLVENQCVTSCGQTPRSYGCCPCPDGMVNARTCSMSTADSGTSSAVSCDTRKVLCKRATPVCPQGQVPSVVGVCYGDCVPIESCPCGAPEDCPNSNEYTCHKSQGRCGPYV